ncbi:MAG: branched-chain amino acid ABC transporter permease [Desulfobacteraceae bacterium]|nr:MAG: branched-chain amino acid ABC transporter permease [Desulfobacteraceae bacterium]
MEIIVYGTINSVSLALMGLGFAMVYGISRVPNFAHGALYIVCGFVTWTMLHKLGIPYALAIILSLAVNALLGTLMYRFILIRVRGMNISEIICSYAIGLAILEGLRYGGFRGMTYTLPVFIEGSLSIGGVPVDVHRIVMMIVGILLVAGLWVFTHFTKVGLALQGMAQDERAALMLGIDSDLMAMVAMGFGAMLAGVAAILILPLGNIVVESGYHVLIMSIAVCIVGGLGSWMGAFFAAFIIGYTQILTVVFIGSHFQMVVAILAIILTLILKPSGLFGQQKELEERV